MLREYNVMKEDIKNPNNAVEYDNWKQWKRIASIVRQIQRVNILVPEGLNKID